MSEEKTMVTARLPADLVEDLEEKQEYYGNSRTDALAKTSRQGLRAARPNVYQIEVDPSVEKRIDTIAEERGKGVEEVVVQLVEHGIDSEADDVFVAEFPRDAVRDIEKFAERERLDREGAVRALVEKGLRADREESENTEEVAGVGASGKAVIFGVALFAISGAISPGTLPYYNTQLRNLLLGVSLLFILAGMVWFALLAVSPYLKKLKPTGVLER